ncbi:MAG: sulfotransferase [Pseudomonadaceae bacterium]|nr:sulfotransferase [Pseudomonadaceae bacterium]
MSDRAETTRSSATKSEIETANADTVRQAQEHMRNARFDAAEDVLRARLEEIDSGRTPLLYNLAVCLRYQDKADDASQILERVLDAQPDHGRAHQEAAHIYFARNQLERARESYERAVACNTSLLASWKALANLYALFDLTLNPAFRNRQSQVLEQIDYLEGLAPALRGVLDLTCEGKLAKADAICRAYLRDNKTDVEGMRLLADIGVRLGVLLDAEFLLETAAELEPDNRRVKSDLANAYLRMQKFDSALAHTRQLVRDHPQRLELAALHANALASSGHHDAAIELYDDVLANSSGQHQLHIMRGHALKTVGRLDDAIASYRAGYEVRPSHGDAYWSLANTKTYRFAGYELESMRHWAKQPSTSLDDQAHLHFALGKALEDRQQFAQAFEHFERGNALKQSQLQHNPDNVIARVADLQRTCDSKLFARHEHSGHDASDPIFILGLPRAGSTLLEQILASHSKIDGTFELPHVIALAQRLRKGSDSGYPGVLAELEPSWFARFGRQFIEQTAVHRGQAPMFIDKNPNNFFHIGLIRLMLPNARIIDARRHPMACCFSGFKQLFGQGQEFTYDLQAIGSYYRQYVALMDHWDRVLPGFVLRVQHEDVIDDLEGQTHRMLEFCGLDFEEQCLRFFETDRAVRTPSSEQVRQPIYRSGMDSWKNYDGQLEPLKQALGPELCARYLIS